MSGSFRPRPGWRQNHPGQSLHSGYAIASPDSSDLDDDPPPLMSSFSSNFNLQLDAIRTSLDILDFKTAIQLSTATMAQAEQSESEPSKALSELYYLRSIAHEKSGDTSLGIEDARQAVESNRKDPKCHVRVALAHQAAALESISLANQSLDEEDLEPSSLNLSLFSLRLTKDQMLSAQNVERKSPFRRISPEQFIKIVSFCSPPSLALAMAVTRRWRSSILTSKELFRNFRMEGKCGEICEGLEFFKKHSFDSLKRIELNVKEQTGQEVVRLRSIITSFSSTLEELSIEHTGLLGFVFNQILDSCPKLKVIKSTSGTAERPAVQDREIRLFTGKKDCNLQTLVWHQNSYDISYELMSGSRFKHLKQLDVRSLKVNAAFTINMLTSCPRLEAVKISGSMPQVWDASIPPLDLVQLNHLELQIVPSNIDGPSFFSRLNAPKLEVLKISDVILDELQGFKFMSGLKELEIGNINSENRSYLGERDASDLLKILEKTSSLQTLGLHLKPKRTNYRFWNYFLSVLTPQSSHNLRKGGGEVFSILPSLQFLKLGGDSLQSPSVLPSELALSDELVGSIASLVASRYLASFGRSKAMVALAANGSSVREELEELKGKGVTSTDWSLSEWKPIVYLWVHMNVKAEKRFVDTIKQVVPECDLPYSWVRFEWGV